jgi:hypothetical protein
MKRALRKTLKIAGVVLGAIVLLLLLFNKPLVRNIVQSRLAKGTGTTARFDRLDYTLFPLRVSIGSLELTREDAFQKMGISLKSLEAGGKFWKLIRGVKPALDSIEIDGLSFRLEQKAVSDEPLDVEAMLLQASDALGLAGRISLTNARLAISLLTLEVDLENLDLTLEPGGSRDVIAYAIGRGDLGVRDRSGAFLLTTGLISSGRLGLASPFDVDAAFTLNSPRLAAGGIEDSVAALTLAVKGRFDKSAQELTVTRLAAGVPGLFDFEGAGAGRLGHGIFLEAEARARLASLEGAAALLRPRLPAGFREAALRGRAELSGKYMLQSSDGESKDSLSALLSLEGVELDHVVGGLPVRLRAAGRIDASGTSRDPRLSADIRCSVGGISTSGFSVAGSDISLVASGGKSGAEISRLEARIAGLAFGPSAEKRISFDEAVLTGKGSFDLAGKSATLTSLEARLPGLAPLRLSGRFGFGTRAAYEVRFEGRGLDVAALRAIASPFVPAGFAGWDLAATADLSLAYRAGASEGDWGVSGTVSLAGATFNDPSFTIAGEDLDPVIRFEGASSASKGLSFTGALDIGRGESLWKAVYVSWSKHPLTLTVAGRYDPVSGVVDELAARAILPEIGTIDASGSAKLLPAPSFDLRIEAGLSLGPLYSLYSQAGATEEKRMKLEGRLGADLRVRKDGDSLSVAGRVRLADTDLERPLTETLLVGISADLPVHYESARGPADTPDTTDAALPEEGYLRIRELSSPFLSLASVELPLRGGPNALGLEPVGLELFGGRLELGRTTFRFDPASGSFRGLGSLALRDVDIARFPIQSPQFKLTGKIQAEFPRLDIGSRLIAVSGRGEADVFGGKIVLRDLAVSDPFTSGRSISLNIDLVELDLKKLTDEVPFGEVTGIVNGEVRGLVITYGQPARFDFRLESVPRKGVPQTFSLKAVDNLTVLSSGRQASAGAGGFFMRFIRGFRYEKLGIVSMLRNDTFTLNGTIHEGGVEYLVKKPALFGISVVNREPGKIISFKEMTGRLKRVGQSEK